MARTRLFLAAVAAVCVLATWLACGAVLAAGRAAPPDPEVPPCTSTS